MACSVLYLYLVQQHFNHQAVFSIKLFPLIEYCAHIIYSARLDIYHRNRLDADDTWLARLCKVTNCVCSSYNWFRCIQYTKWKMGQFTELLQHLCDVFFLCLSVFANPDLANNVTLFFYIFFTNFIYLVLYFTVALARAYTSRGTAHGCGSALSAGGRVWRADKEIFVLVEPATPGRLHGGDARARGLTRSTVHW